MCEANTCNYGDDRYWDMSFAQLLCPVVAIGVCSACCVSISSGEKRGREGAMYMEPTPAITSGTMDMSFAWLLCLVNRTTERKMVNRGMDVHMTWWK